MFDQPVPASSGADARIDVSAVHARTGFGSAGERLSSSRTPTPAGSVHGGSSYRRADAGAPAAAGRPRTGPAALRGRQPRVVRAADHRPWRRVLRTLRGAARAAPGRAGRRRGGVLRPGRTRRVGWWGAPTCSSPATPTRTSGTASRRRSRDEAWRRPPSVPCATGRSGRTTGDGSSPRCHVRTSPRNGCWRRPGSCAPGRPTRRTSAGSRRYRYERRFDGGA